MDIQIMIVGIAFTIAIVYYILKYVGVPLI